VTKLWLGLVNQTFFRLRLIVLAALTTGMRIAEIFGLRWADLLYKEDLIVVRAKLKSGKMRYVPMPSELAAEFNANRRFLGRTGFFLQNGVPKRERRRVDKSFETILELAGIEDLRFQDITEVTDKLIRTLDKGPAPVHSGVAPKPTSASLTVLRVTRIWAIRSNELFGVGCFRPVIEARTLALPRTHVR
jgi:integrase